jgi:hypothetical protein
MTSMNEPALYSHMNIRYGYFGNTLPINNNTPSAMATIINMKLLFSWALLFEHLYLHSIIFHYYFLLMVYIVAGVAAKCI